MYYNVDRGDSKCVVVLLIPVCCEPWFLTHAFGENILALDAPLLFIGMIIGIDSFAGTRYATYSVIRRTTLLTPKIIIGALTLFVIGVNLT